MSQTTIFCLPFAGGSASSIYADWEKYVPQSIRLIALELPGRGSRAAESPVADLHILIEDLFRSIEPQLAGKYYLLGASMGGLLAYELAKRICASTCVAPSGLIVAAQKAPSILSPAPYLCDQPEDKIVDFLRQIGGLSDLMLHNPKLFSCYLPVIRADLSLVEKYRYKEHAPLPMPIYTFYSEEDTLYSKSSQEEWQHFSSCRFELHDILGGHFFVKTQVNDFLGRLLPLL